MYIVCSKKYTNLPIMCRVTISSGHDHVCIHFVILSGAIQYSIVYVHIDLSLLNILPSTFIILKCGISVDSDQHK